MPTLAGDPQRWSQSFGTDAERYDRARPLYPAELIGRITDLSPGSRVLDVGCGTGIAARQLQAAGCSVLGVEPDDRMAAFARQTGVPVETGTFETWDPAGRTFDAVVAAQSWHWVSAETGPLAAARVLRPGGLFVALWHVFTAPAPISQAFADAYRRVAPDAPFRLSPTPEQALATYEAGCARTADSLVSSGAFADPEQWKTAWDHTYSTAGYLDFMLTTGALTPLAHEQVAVVVDDVSAAIEASGGTFTTRHHTVAVAAVRT